jgi:hypothetical protein
MLGSSIRLHAASVAPLRMGIGERTQTTRTGEGDRCCYYRTVLVTIVLYVNLYHDLQRHDNNKSNC